MPWKRREYEEAYRETRQLQRALGRKLKNLDAPQNVQRYIDHLRQTAFALLAKADAREARWQEDLANREEIEQRLLELNELCKVLRKVDRIAKPVPLSTLRSYVRRKVSVILFGKGD